MRDDLTLRQYVAVECLKAIIGTQEYLHIYEAASDADRYALALIAVWAGVRAEDYDETTPGPESDRNVSDNEPRDISCPCELSRPCSHAGADNAR
jgi:hypothetical protein